MCSLLRRKGTYPVIPRFLRSKMALTVRSRPSEMRSEPLHHTPPALPHPPDRQSQEFSFAAGHSAIALECPCQECPPAAWEASDQACTSSCKHKGTQIAQGYQHLDASEEGESQRAIIRGPQQWKPDSSAPYPYFTTLHLCRLQGDLKHIIR